MKIVFKKANLEVHKLHVGSGYDTNAVERRSKNVFFSIFIDIVERVCIKGIYFSDQHECM